MPALASDLRKTLEATVVKARDKAEGGARDALTALAVDASEPFGSMGDEERRLRNRLRARGRQLGDQRDPQKGTQSIERLVREMAYEHWHRMLFARFLAENQLLIEPSSGVSISLDECEELAAEEGTDLWGLAAQFAQEMLPQIFRTDDPVLAARLPLEIRQQLQGLVAELEAETFTANDSLGWTYQFWQTKRKKEVNDSGVKIGADEISPVTQLFTEDYMVDFLLDNTLGAWHAGKVLAGNPQLAETAQSEEELRQAVSLPGCPWSYLRFIKTDDGAWKPAAGVFKEWPKNAAELKCLDPCMGSGHFVVAMFDRLVALRLAEDGLGERESVPAVIKDNLFGLEIDSRCTQIAAFNLALAAWRRLGYCKLPLLNLACSGLAPNATQAEWLALAGVNQRLRNGMGRLYKMFDNASILGSLINPSREEGDLLVAGFHELQPLLDEALAQEVKDETVSELSIAARGMAKAVQILSGSFALVATNVPYLGRVYQSEELTTYIDKFIPEGKHDLAFAFFMRISEFISNVGTAAVVAPQSWLYLPSYKSFRQQVLSSHQIHVITRLGENAFESTSAAGAFVALTIFDGKNTVHEDSRIVAIDASALRGEEPIPTTSKALILKGISLGVLASTENSVKNHDFSAKQSIRMLKQIVQLENPLSVIAFEEIASSHKMLSEYASCLKGASAGDINRFCRQFWEVTTDMIGKDWELYLKAPDKTGPYLGRGEIIFWQKESGDMKELAMSVKHLNHAAQNWLRGKPNWGKKGVAVGLMTTIPATLYAGEIYDANCCAIIPHDEQLVPALWAYCSSNRYNEDLRKLNQSISIASNNLLLQVPFDLEYWRDRARQLESQSSGFSGEKSRPDQWVYNQNLTNTDPECVLQVAACMLMGYQWPMVTCSPVGPSDQAGQQVLSDFYDEDGIVCLDSLRGEASATERIRRILAAVYLDEWSSAKEKELLLACAVGSNSKKADADIENWLRRSFFEEHCRLFQGRPFIWQIWDGNPHGFSALLNSHKLLAPNGRGRKTLEQLTFSYLGDWIDRQKLDQAEGINGSDDRLAAALDLQSQLKKILEGEPPYDIFVRWKPLHAQPIGWDPDINDGVRLNIRPFLNAQLRTGGKKGAGILRAKLGTIKWSKDRGKEPFGSKDVFPWFWGWDEDNAAVATDFGAPVPGAPPASDSFDGNRWNDLHYTRAAKEAARSRHSGGSS